MNPTPLFSPPATARAASRKAFTLIELMVAGGITTLLLLGMTGVFDQSMKAWRLSSRRADAEREVRAALATIQRDLKGMVVESNYPIKFNIIDNNQVNIPPGRTMPAVSGLEGTDWADVSAVLFFASALRTGTNRGDVHGIGYYVAWDTNANNKQGAYNLYRRIQRPNELLVGVLAHFSNSLFGPYHTNSLPDAEVVAANVLNFWAYMAGVAPTTPVPFDLIRFANGQIPPTNLTVRPAYVQLELTAYGNEVVRGFNNRSEWADTNNIRKFGRTYLWRVDL
jgi:type II secretory pathway pseudopilin PulG